MNARDAIGSANPNKSPAKPIVCNSSPAEILSRRRSPGTFSTTEGLVGNFYVGYRENLPGTGHPVARPPTFDLFVASEGLTGDYNENGTVDAADYVLWRKNPSNTATTGA